MKKKFLLASASILTFGSILLGGTVSTARAADRQPQPDEKVGKSSPSVRQYVSATADDAVQQAVGTVARENPGAVIAAAVIAVVIDVADRVFNAPRSSPDA